MNDIIIPLVTGIVCLVVGVVIGFLYRKRVAEKEIGSAETEATRIINEAIKAGETKKREAILEAKDEIHKQRTEADRELKERRNETQQLERRLIQREEALDKKSDTLERKNEDLSRQLEAAQKEKDDLARVKAEQLEKLEQIASMTRDEAREMLVQSIEAEATHDAAVKLREINQRVRDESEQTAREIISTAIQRCAADHVSEADRIGRPAAQRRDEGPHHRPRGPQYPHARDADRRGSDHRRHAGGHYAFRRSTRCAARSRASRLEKPDRGWTHPSRPHRGNGGKSPP